MHTKREKIERVLLEHLVMPCHAMSFNQIEWHRLVVERAKRETENSCLLNVIFNMFNRFNLVFFFFRSLFSIIFRSINFWVYKRFKNLFFYFGKRQNEWLNWNQIPVTSFWLHRFFFYFMFMTNTTQTFT